MTAITKTKSYNEYFTVKKRFNRDKLIVVKRDDSPKDLEDLIYEIHNIFDVMPDDWIYETIRDAFRAFEVDYDKDIDLEEILSEMEPDIYNDDLTEWARSSYAINAIDEAVEEYGSKDFINSMQVGQLRVKDQIYREVHNFINQ